MNSEPYIFAWYGEFYLHCFINQWRVVKISKGNTKVAKVEDQEYLQLMLEVLKNHQSQACVSRAFLVLPLLPLMCQEIYEKFEIC